METTHNYTIKYNTGAKQEFNGTLTECVEFVKNSIKVARQINPAIFNQVIKILHGQRVQRFINITKDSIEVYN